MRILTVGNMYPPHHLGGNELVWQSAVRYLRRRGHVVRVLTSDHRQAEGLPEEDDDVDRDLWWYWRDHGFPRLSARERHRLERHNAGVLDRRLSRFAPDLVAWWAMGGMSLSLLERVRRAGLPATAVVCDDWMLYGPRVDGWLRAFERYRWLRGPVERLTGIPARLELTGIGPVLFLSETIRRRALSSHALPDTRVCGRGPDRDLFRPRPLSPWRWRLLYAGRIDRRKGIELAIEALALLPAQATLAVDGAGDDGYLRELRELVARRGLHDRVSFGRTGRERLADVYGLADAVLFPVVWEEPWGLVPLEAMAVGTPVIGTGRGGSGEFMRDGENCLLFDPEDGPSGLARRLEELAGDAGLRERLREGGLRTSGDLSAEAFERAVEELCLGAVSP